MRRVSNKYIQRFHNTSEDNRYLKSFSSDLKIFTKELTKYLLSSSNKSVLKVQDGKDIFVTSLYRQRGKMAKRLMHSGMAGIAAFGVMVAPIVAEEFPGASTNPWEAPSPSQVLSASTDSSLTATIVADHEYRSDVIQYEVQEGDTVSSIASKFGVSTDTVRWQNDLASKDSIKVGEKLEILPVTGVAHKVNKGDTVYSIAKKYDVDPQVIVNYPFNTFVNDETFELAVGQSIIVPDGVKPDTSTGTAIAVSRPRQLTPNAGTVVASGQFAWPTQGVITQYYSWYHPGVDIANRAAPNVLAADSGTVITSGWSNVGYGNHVIIDHGNGYRTLYAHMQKLYVVAGQTVNRGDALGQMGSTGRSTGTHLHFEVRLNGAHLNPLSVLK